MTTGVLVMAYGTPTGPDDVEAFYTDIRHGRPPTGPQLAELQARYAAIGGASPLAEKTAAQVAALGRALEVIAPDHFRTAFGAKHSAPKIEAAVDELADAGVSAIVGLVLAPHYSVGSVGEYLARARERAAARSVAAAFVTRWGAEPELIELLAGRTAAAVASLGDRATSEIEVVFTAHSLPERVVFFGRPLSRRTRRDRGARRGTLPARPLADRLAERGTDRGAVARPGHHRTPRRHRQRGGTRRRRLPSRLHLGSPRTLLRP